VLVGSLWIRCLWGVGEVSEFELEVPQHEAGPAAHYCSCCGGRPGVQSPDAGGLTRRFVLWFPRFGGPCVQLLTRPNHETKRKGSLQVGARGVTPRRDVPDIPVRVLHTERRQARPDVVATNVTTT
jgi:hypothetical protein